MSERVEQKQIQDTGGLAGELLESVRAALSRAPEADRYRALAAFFGDLADGQARGGGAASAEAEQLAALSKKLTRLGEEKALVDDALAEARADLDHANRQLEAERDRAKETERISTDQRTRLRTAQQQVDELEQQLVAKNSQLHEADNEVEALRLKLQRMEMSAGDTSRADGLEDAKRELVEQLEHLRSDHEQLRKDKDAEIERLKSKTLEAEAATTSGPDKVLSDLWDRLARAKPALAPGGKIPTEAAAERLFDAFIELAFFAHDFDQTMRPFLGSFARYSDTLQRPWDAYAKAAPMDEIIREVIDIEHGKPPAVLKMRLLALKRWVLATIIGSDTAIESVAHELEDQMRGDVGMKDDPHRKLRDYIRDDGHQLFHERIRELRSIKLADVYAHGA